MASIFRVGYEARYTVSHSSFRSVLPGKCSIIRKITRDVEEKGAREICSQTFLTDRNDSLELSAFFIRSEEIDLSWHATPSKIEIPSFLFPLPQLEFTYAFEFFWCLQFVPWEFCKSPYWDRNQPLNESIETFPLSFIGRIEYPRCVVTRVRKNGEGFGSRWWKLRADVSFHRELSWNFFTPFTSITYRTRAFYY